ncbi:hypothetical protein COBT_003998, partial [Conglomerata obtusa]
GSIERANQTLFDKLRKLSNYDEDMWEEKLKEATYAQNISFNRAISTSPYALRFGCQPTLEIDAKYNIQPITYNKEKLLITKNKKFEEYAKKNIQKGEVEYSKEFCIGEDVIIFKDSLESKFLSKWHEGFKILKRLHENSYLVTNGKKVLRLNKIHI